MPWLAQQDCDLVRTWARKSAIPLIASSPSGKIHWCNEAFENLLGYSEFELAFAQGGKGMTWHQLSVDDDNLLADQKMVDELLAGRREHCTVRKQYRPKNEKPIWAELNVLRYPETGDIQYFLVIAIPLKNGSQAAAQIASEQMSQVISKLEELKEHHRHSIVKIEAAIAPKTESEQIAGAMARVINNNPRKAGFAVLVLLVMVLGTQLVQAVEAVKRMMGMQVDTVKVQQDERN